MSSVGADISTRHDIFMSENLSLLSDSSLAEDDASPSGETEAERHQCGVSRFKQRKQETKISKS